MRYGLPMSPWVADLLGVCLSVFVIVVTVFFVVYVVQLWREMGRP